MTELVKLMALIEIEEGLPVVITLIIDDSSAVPKMVKLMLDNQ